jgi:protein-tyrosine-phosphatase
MSSSEGSVAALRRRSASPAQVVQAVVGAPVHPLMVTELAPLGLDGEAERFVARQLVPELVESADLVLGASLRHRSTVVEQAPGALPIAFGLREFAGSRSPSTRRCSPPRRWPVPTRSSSGHGTAAALVPPVPPQDDLIPDPIGGPPFRSLHCGEIDRRLRYGDCGDHQPVGALSGHLARAERRNSILADHEEQVSCRLLPDRVII